MACSVSKKLMFIDFVMEKEDDPSKYTLACVYYSPCRGGRCLQLAREYMQKIQEICNFQMEFHPQVIFDVYFEMSSLDLYLCVQEMMDNG